MGANYPLLVQNEGLTLVPLPSDRRWTAARWAELLRDCGPCYMRTKVYDANGHSVGGHIIVLVGAKTSTNTVTVHDPAKGPNIELSIDDHNRRFSWDVTPVSQYSMMCKLPQRSRPRADAVSEPTGGPRSKAIIGRHR